MVIPEKYHQTVLKIAQRGTWRKEEDVFPAYYRCNTRRKLGRTLNRHGFSEVVVYGHHSEPAYLSFSGWAYFLGTLYQRIIPSTFANSLFSFARKELIPSNITNQSNE
jgi:hypothetical protein